MTAQQLTTLAAARCATRPRNSAEEPGVVRADVLERPLNDELATAQTIRYMLQYAAEDADLPAIDVAVQAAYRFAAITEQSSDVERARSIWSWLRTHILFRPDPDDAELLIRPELLFRMKRPEGDCDDFSMAAAAMLLRAGIPVSYLTLAADAENPSLYSHVCVVAHLIQGDVTIDASHGRHFGWEAPSYGKRRVWPLLRSRLNGLGQIDWGALINIGARTASDVVRARFGNPPPGTLIQTPQGTVFRQPEGSGAFAFPGASVSLGGSNTTLLLVVAVVLVLLVARR